jgi:hypothetical protein
MDEQTQITREHLETSKERAIVWREWGYFVAIIVFIAFGIYGLHAWTESNKVVGAINSRAGKSFDRLDAMIDTFNAKLAAIDTSKIGPLLESGTTVLDGLKADEGQLAGLISDMRGEVVPLFASVRGAIDEAHAQVKQNGDESAKTLASVRTAVDDTDVLIKNTDREATRILREGALMIETTNPKLQDLLAHTDNVVITADGTIKAYQPVGEKLASTLGHLDNMAADSDKRWHSILFPPPVKGFWPNVKRTVGFVYRPMFDGAALYFRLSSIPIRVTQPIPIGKP